MFETKKLTREKIEQKRAERKGIRNINRKRKITRHCCSLCGEPKSYVCLGSSSEFEAGKGLSKVWG